MTEVGRPTIVAWLRTTVIQYKTSSQQNSGERFHDQHQTLSLVVANAYIRTGNPISQIRERNPKSVPNLRYILARLVFSRSPALMVRQILKSKYYPYADN